MCPILCFLFLFSSMFILLSFLNIVIFAVIIMATRVIIMATCILVCFSLLLIGNLKYNLFPRNSGNLEHICPIDPHMTHML